MKEVVNVNRRDFLRTGAMVGGGLIISLYLPEIERASVPAQPKSTFAPNAFIRIGTDGSVTIVVGKSEMGQGVYTSLAMLIAEELEADWDKIRVESAPVDAAYNHTGYGIQMTGASSSVSSSWDQLRKAGATARAMLLAAAAGTWGVEPASCRSERGVVIHEASGRRLSYGRLAEKASGMTPPKDVVLKAPKDFKIIGKPVKRLDTPEKTNGAAIFGIDVKIPGMLTAVVARSPVFGGKVKSFSAEKAKAIRGVRNVVQIGSGVAVVADGFWPATSGRDALEIVWDEGPLASFDSQTQRGQYAALAKEPGAVAKQAGDPDAVWSRAGQKLEAIYEVPYLAHAPMEPLNCVADVRASSCEVWTGTQFQTVDRYAAAQTAGLKPEQVKVHTTLLGGGFGRRAVPDSHFVREAVEISKAVKAPVKVIWTREDDIRGGYYRPAYYHRLTAALDEEKKLVAWSHRIVGQSIFTGTPFEPYVVKNGIDMTSVEGASNLPYAIPNLKVDYHRTSVGVPVLWWRSVGGSHTAFVTECFLDEIASAAGKDPYEFRRALLIDHPRHRAVLELAAEKAGWAKPLPKGRGRGVAVHEFSGSFIAQVAEVSVSASGKVNVHRVVCAVDCGMVVNPNTVEAQMESAIVYGLTAALYGEITLEKGRVHQSNFHDYPMLRIEEMPLVEVHIVPSTAPPSGVGEPGVPPIAPAVANAIFAATGNRIRRLPIALKT